MTLVIGINTDNWALVMADSRITQRETKVHIDCCQKVFRISKSTIVGFCGGLSAAADVLSGFVRLYSHNPESLDINILLERLSSALKIGARGFKEIYRDSPSLGLVIAGRDRYQQFHMFGSKSPNYRIELVQKKALIVMGSGSTIIEPVITNFENLLGPWQDFSDHTMTKIEEKYLGERITSQTAFQHIISYVESRLESLGISSVSRVFHGMMIDKQGVWPLTYQLSHLVRNENDDSLTTQNITGIRIGEKGQFIQYSGDGNEIELLSPEEVISEVNIHNNDRTIDHGQ